MTVVISNISCQCVCEGDISTAFATYSGIVQRFTKCQYCGLMGRCEGMAMFLEYLYTLLGEHIEKQFLVGVSLIPCLSNSME